MPTKLGLISDTHSTTDPLKNALSIFEREKVDSIICAGDVAGYGQDQLLDTINLLIDYNCQVIRGNHDYCDPGYDYNNQKHKIETYLDNLPATLQLTIENRRIYIVHAEPPDKMHGGIKLLDTDGSVLQERKKDWTNRLNGFEYDILIVGHTHQVFHEKMGDVLVINPGSTAFNHTCMILTLPEMAVEIFPVSDHKPILCWNWSMFNHTRPFKS